MVPPAVTSATLAACFGLHRAGRHRQVLSLRITMHELLPARTKTPVTHSAQDSATGASILLSSMTHAFAHSTTSANSNTLFPQRNKVSRYVK
jgi:hypothetical protein